MEDVRVFWVSCAVICDLTNTLNLLVAYLDPSQAGGKGFVSAQQGDTEEEGAVQRNSNRAERWLGC